MIYKFCPPTSHSLQNLRTQVLYCRHHTDFNDPFEFWSRIVEGIPRREEGDRYQTAVACWGFPDPDSAEDPSEYFESLEENQPAFAAMFDHTRIACFGAENDSLLMWAHYADGLRGFCVGFDEATLATHDREVYFTNVEYLEAPPLVDSFLYAVAEDQFEYHHNESGEDLTEEDWRSVDGPAREMGRPDYKSVALDSMRLMRMIWRRAFAVKPLQWEYERERRLLVRIEEPGTSPLLHSYPATAVREIVVGERMPGPYREALLEVARQHFPGARLRFGARSRDAYALTLREFSLAATE